jgi:hypothetical protein
MGDSRDRRDPNTDSFVDWTRQPEFRFADEVDALTTVQELGEELRNAREQVRQITRYLQAAVVAARHQTGATPTALINHSGVARQTVYTMLGDTQADEETR